MSDSKTFLLIDAAGILYRSFFALPPLTSPSGVPSGALFGFIRSILKVVHKVRPDFIVAIFDGPQNKKSRLELYSSYKAHRKPTPDELLVQIQEARKFCTLWGIPELTETGVEADDTIASVVTYAKKHQFGPIYICTADKDLAQLVDETVFVINPAKDDAISGPAQIEEQYKLPPNMLADYLSLIGDSSDNIPGIDGIGPKTAVELIKTYGSLENILQHATEIPGKKGEYLSKGTENARLSRKLVELNTSVVVPQEQFFYTLKNSDTAKVQEFFLQMGLKTLLQLLPHPQTPSDTLSNYCTILHTRKEYEDMLQSLKTNTTISISLQRDESLSTFLGIGIALNKKSMYYISCENDLDPRFVIHALSERLEKNNISLCGHDLKSTLHILVEYGLKVPLLAFDTELASWLVSPHEKSHTLADLSARLLMKEKSSLETLLGKGKKAKLLSTLDSKTVAQYTSDDLCCILTLKEMLEKQLLENGMEHLFKTMEMPLIPILLEIEQTGVYVDVAHLKELQKRVETKLTAIAKEIYAMAGKEFNINSPKQLGDVLFVDLKLPKSRKGKQHLSTNVDVLEELAHLHPIAKKVLDYRMLDKLQSTYIEALPLLIKEDHRVHCTFLQTGTSTGRIACQNPNLQNIPIKTDLGKEIRAAFKPQKEHFVFISSDYSQVELRILAHMSRDPSLVKAFEADIDIHTQTASKVFHVPLEEVTESMRRKAKAVNFGLIYGQQAFGLASELKISPKEAQEIINNYFAEYSSILKLLEEIKTKSRSTGYSETLTGRRRPLPDLNSHDFFTRAAAERFAINTPFQGTGADVIKKAMIDLDHTFKTQRIQTKMILQIHDELLFEAPESEVDIVIPLIRSHMENAMKLVVPLKVEISVGKNWKEC